MYGDAASHMLPMVVVGNLFNLFGYLSLRLLGVYLVDLANGCWPGGPIKGCIH